MSDDEINIFSIELPDRVSNVKFTDITDSSANISWIGVGRNESCHYTIDCHNCDKLNTFPVNTIQASVVLEKLDASTQYNISVTVNNSITVLTRKSLYEFAELQTRAGGM